MYEVIYNYEDEYNIRETFEGSWPELQEFIKDLRNTGCYNISANCVSGDDYY